MYLGHILKILAVVLSIVGMAATAELRAAEWSKETQIILRLFQVIAMYCQARKPRYMQ